MVTNSTDRTSLIEKPPQAQSSTLVLLTKEQPFNLEITFCKLRLLRPEKGLAMTIKETSSPNSNIIIVSVKIKNIEKGGK